MRRDGDRACGLQQIRTQFLFFCVTLLYFFVSLFCAVDAPWRISRFRRHFVPQISIWFAENSQLIGGQCGDCGATAFSAQPRCLRGSGGQVSELLLPHWQDCGGLDNPGFPDRIAVMLARTGTNFVPVGIALVQLSSVTRVGDRQT